MVFAVGETTNKFIKKAGIIFSSVDQFTGQAHLFDYSELTQKDSSFFNAWIWVDGDFRFHQDSDIRGEKALTQYVGKQSSILQLKDSLIFQKDSSSFREHIESQTDFIKTKEQRTWG